MASIVRWNPMREMVSLRDEMNRIFDRAFDDAPLAQWRTSANWGLAVDVAENDDAYIVKASVPGMNPDDLDITISDNVLTIKGEYKSDETISEERYHIRERRYGSFGRSISLPMPVNADDVEANYESGVLTLTVPKAEEVKPRRITVNVTKNGQS